MPKLNLLLKSKQMFLIRTKNTLACFKRHKQMFSRLASSDEKNREILIVFKADGIRRTIASSYPFL